jgi:putative Holliday junction resolvase
MSAGAAIDADTTLFGFDYGERRIGVAVGQTITRSASPLAIIAVRDGQPDWPALTTLIADYAPRAFVVGMPTNDDGSEHPLAGRVLRFCNQLRGRYHVPVETISEFLSSVEATSRAGQDIAPVDAVAAQVILETWLNEVRRQ